MRTFLAVVVLFTAATASLSARAQQPKAEPPKATGGPTTSTPSTGTAAQPQPDTTTEPATPQPGTQPGTTAQPGAVTQPGVTTQPGTTPQAQAKPQQRTARVRHHRHAGRPESLCSVVNGWRAFRNRYDPRGYFDTRPVCCCRL